MIDLTSDSEYLSSVILFSLENLSNSSVRNAPLYRRNMDLPTNDSLSKPTKPSKLLALIALVVAFALPFLLVKTFPHKQKSYVSSIPMSLPDSQDSQD